MLSNPLQNMKPICSGQFQVQHDQTRQGMRNPIGEIIFPSEIPDCLIPIARVMNLALELFVCDRVFKKKEVILIVLNDKQSRNLAVHARAS